MITPEQLAKNDDEHGHQAALFCWLAQNRQYCPELALAFAIPNGGQRNKATASNLVAEGVKSGVPDVFLPVPRYSHDIVALGLSHKFYNGLFIEMKKPGVRLKRQPKTKYDTGGVSENQQGWMANLENQGYKCVVCYHWMEAANEIKFYLTGTYLDGFGVDT